MAALSVATLGQDQSFQRFTNDPRPFSQTSSSNFHGLSNQRPQEDFLQPTVGAERTKLPRPQIRRPTEQHFASNDGFQFGSHQQNVLPAPAVQQPAVHGVSNFQPQQHQQSVFQHRQAAVPQQKQSQSGFFAQPQPTLKPVTVEQLNAQRAQISRHPSANFQQSPQRQAARPVSQPQSQFAAPVQADDNFHQNFVVPQFGVQQPSFPSTPSADTAVRHDLGFGDELRSSEHRRPPAGKRPVLSDELSEDELIRKHQAENAKYSFQTSVTDTINDHQIVRQEMRDGLKLTGAYSYSDGFYKRTVFYEADENGYRVIK